MNLAAWIVLALLAWVSLAFALAPIVGRAIRGPR